MKNQQMSRSVRNPYISLMKLAASCALVCVHIKFPGVPGYIIECIGRFGVPFFFAISGFFFFKTDSAKLLKRLKKLITILIIADIIYLGWGIFSQCLMGEQSVKEYLSGLISIKQLASFIFLDMRTGHYSYHLWYITAQIKVYAALFVFLTFTNNSYSYKRLYSGAFAAFLFFIAFGINALAVDFKVDPSLTRNSLFYGFPMFMAGLFLREYKDQIIERFHLTKWKLLSLILAGFALSLLEFFGFGKSEMPLGMLVSVSAMILLLTGFPVNESVSQSKWAVYIGDLETMSLVVYLIHPLVFYIANFYPVFRPVHQQGWLFPLFILFASILISIVFCLTRRAWRGIRLHAK